MTQLSNFGFTRKSGILMPISSLPSRYGIGSFGKSAYEFVDFLVETGNKCWQVLPLCPTSYGDSPYQSPAALAGNPYFIDLDILGKRGLLTPDELRESRCSSQRVDYGRLFNTRFPLLRKAYARLLATGGAESEEYLEFSRKNAFWLYDYSLFMALKEHYGYRAWSEWDDEHKNVSRARLDKERFSKECGFWRWVQFEFFSQWDALVSYAHSREILIIGDMPIYVAHDSMDVWQSPEQFLLDDDYMSTVVAGCPPDFFSPDGQLWGNPIYNWELMELQSFEWWCKRIEMSFRLYDILRIDHFRGFAGYYCIPYGDKTAVGGRWEEAPGIKLFGKIRERFPTVKIIAEDLGYITEDVRRLLSITGFPGMKMLQFAFYDDDNEYLPRLYPDENCVVYPGSHDSDCIKSWFKLLDLEAKRRYRRECPRNKEQSRTYDLIELALSSKANLAVVPMQDYLELSNGEGRMNTPSVAEGNWTWRLGSRYRSASLVNRMRMLNLRNGRI